MKLEELKELKERLIELRNKRILCISKNVFCFVLASVLMAGSLKILGFGFPFVCDKEKKYKVEFFNNSNLRKVKYFYKDELDDIEDEKSTVSIKSKYQIDDDGKYFRNVSVYEINEDFVSYQDILDNYDDYFIGDNMVEEYLEYSTDIDNNFVNNDEVVVSYSVVNKDEYIEVLEREDVNMLVSSFYGLGIFCLGNYIFSNVNSELMYESGEYKRIKRKIKKEESCLK